MKPARFGEAIPDRGQRIVGRQRVRVAARGDARMTAFMMPGLLTTTLMSGSLFGIALPLVQQRETGLLRRLRVTPVHAASVAIAHGVSAVVTGFISAFRN